MRKRRLAYNEFVDEFGNVRKLAIFNRQFKFDADRKVSSSFKKSALDFIYAALKFLTHCIYAFFRCLIKLLGRGLHALLEEKPYQKVQWDGIIPKK
jgi:hypothetical protein